VKQKKEIESFYSCKNTMAEFHIQWWKPLYWCVRLSGAKNASYKLMIASLMWNETTRLINIPHIDDVHNVKEIIKHLGAHTQDVWAKTTSIDPRWLSRREIPFEYGEKSRSSTIFLWVLLHKFWKAIVPLPGWDKIGNRNLDRHFDWLESMWVTRELKDNMLHMQTDGLVWTTYRFAKNTHTGTETLIIAAVCATWKTILENAAEEPEIDDLIMLLNKMWARIRRRAFRTIEIDWVVSLWGAIHSVIPDRNEAVTYACATLLTKWDVILENARHQDLTIFLEKIDEAWWWYEVDDYGVRFFWKWPLRATDITTKIHPWFMTDWQALRAVLMCSAHGTSTIHETIFSNRFSQYVDVLTSMWATFDLFNPHVEDPQRFYNFDRESRDKENKHAIHIQWPTAFSWWEFFVNDLRAWATTMLAAMSAPWKSVLHNVWLIDRWYEKIDKKLQKLGADIRRI